MNQHLRIVLIAADAPLAADLLLRLHGRGYQAASVANNAGLLGNLYSDPPDLVLIDLSKDIESQKALVTTLRSDSFFSAIPILGIVESIEEESFQWDRWPIDDFIRLPINYNEFFCRIALSLTRIKRIFDNNPLTRLPGNTSIQRAIEEAMGKPVSVCYVDINHFKPYNDIFGFHHGDEVLRMLGRILFNTVRDTGGGFCGHIGGDDFVYIVPSEHVENVCQTIISNFDRIIPDLFDEQVMAAGYFSARNRRGELEKIPLLSLSIAVVPMDSGTIDHAAKVAEVAADLKKLAKDSPKSRYVIDQRKNSLRLPDHPPLQPLTGVTQPAAP